jgi:hypothetical protein
METKLDVMVTTPATFEAVTCPLTKDVVEALIAETRFAA